MDTPRRKRRHSEILMSQWKIPGKVREFFMRTGEWPSCGFGSLHDNDVMYMRYILT